MDNIEFEPECKSRGMETGLHSRGEASVALEREFTRMVKEHRKTNMKKLDEAMEAIRDLKG